MAKVLKFVPRRPQLPIEPEVKEYAEKVAKDISKLFTPGQRLSIKEDLEND